MQDSRLFISYARKDGVDFARDLRTRLEAEGFGVWQDLAALEGGRDWWTQIHEALTSKSIEHVVLVLTPETMKSVIIRREIRLSRQEGKQVTPVKGPGLDMGSAPRWMGHIHDLAYDEQWKRLLTILRGPSAQRRTPFMAPNKPDDFVSRPHEFESLKAALIDPRGDAVATVAALKGAGGFGKTALAAALCHDEDIRQAYFDGVLWTTLGENPQDLGGAVADLIERLTGERPGFERTDTLGSKLAESLGDRHCLLVIDDVWREQDLRPFLQGGPHTTRLITTRLDAVLPSKAVRIDVDAMRTDEAVALLAQGLDEAGAKAHASALEALAKRLGEWALLLKLANGFLRGRVKAREPLGRALTGVTSRLDAEGLHAFDAAKSEERGRAVSKTLAVSLDLLTAQERERFRELAVFEEDAEVPIGVGARLWRERAGLNLNAAEDLLAKLFDGSLLLSLDFGAQTFRLHDVIRNYLRQGLSTEELAALHEATIRAIDGLDKSSDALEKAYYYRFKPIHLAGAGRRVEIDALLLDVDWIEAKIAAVGVPFLLADYRLYTRKRAHYLVARTLDLTRTILARHPDQVKPQLLARLAGEDGEGAAAVLESARARICGPVFLPKRPTFSPPGAEIRRFEGHGALVRGVGIVDERRALSASEDGTLRLWDVETGEELRLFEGDGSKIGCLAILGGGRAIVGSEDGALRIWEIETGRLIRRFEAHERWINALAVLSDGRAVSGSRDRTLRLWDVENGKELRRFAGHEGGINGVAVFEGRMLSASEDKTLRLWDVETGAELRRFEGHETGVNAVAFIDAGRGASASKDGTVRIWDLATGAEIRRLKGHEGWVNDVDVLSGGRLVSGSEDKTLQVWNVETGERLRRFEGHGGWVEALAVLSDGRVVSGSEDRTLRLWNMETKDRTRVFGRHTNWVKALAPLDGDRFLSASDDKTIRAWSFETGEELGRFEPRQPEGHGKWINALAAIDARRAVSGSEDKTLRLWDLTTGAELRRFEGHDGWVNALAAIDGRRVISGSEDKTLRVWDVETGEELKRFAGHARRIDSVVAVDGRRAASGSKDGVVWLWDVETGEGIRKFEGHQGGVRALAAIEGRILVSGSEDGTLRVWDIETGQETQRLLGHRNWVRAVAAFDGRRVVSGSSDRTLRLWDVETGLLARFDGDAVFQAVMAFKGSKRIVAGDTMGKVHAFDVLLDGEEAEVKLEPVPAVNVDEPSKTRRPWFRRLLGGES